MRRLDLVGVPKKAAVLALSHACLHSHERHMLQWICSKSPEGKQLWSAFIEQQCIGIGELLCLFPSCLPSFSILATHCPKLTPRLYSITTSQRAHAASLAVAFSVVQFTASVLKEDKAIASIRRKGLCTSYLERLLGKFLNGDSSAPSNPVVRIYPKVSSHFRPPLNTRIPMVISVCFSSFI